MGPLGYLHPLQYPIWCLVIHFILHSSAEHCTYQGAIHIKITTFDTTKLIDFTVTVVSLPQMDGQVIAMLVQNMERLDENVKEESDGVHNTLCE